MSRIKAKWAAATTLFFGVVGGFIGAVFVFSWMLIAQPYLTEKGLIFAPALFLAGYLGAILVAGFSGAIYALLRLLVGSVTYCSWPRRVCLGLVAPVLLIGLLIWAGYHSEAEQIRGPISYAIWNGRFQLFFLVVCSLATMYLHTLVEMSYDFFSTKLMEHSKPQPFF